MQNRVAVLGAAGFIGQNVMEALASTSIVYGLDRNAREGVSGVIDLEKTEPNFNRVDTVVSCASHAHVWGEPVDVMHESQILANVLKAIEKSPTVRTFIYLSSSSVYGDRYPTPVEGQTLSPKSRYGLQKVKAEQTIFRWVISRDLRLGRGVRVFVIRVFNAIGKHQRKTMFPYKVVRNALEGRPTPVFDQVYRSWTPVSDLSMFVSHLAQPHTTKPDRYLTTVNYGTERGRTQDELVALINERMRARDLPEASTFYGGKLRPGESASYSASMKRAHLLFPTMPYPSQDLTSSLDDVIDTVLNDVLTDYETKNMVALNDPIRAY